MRRAGTLITLLSGGLLASCVERGASEGTAGAPAPPEPPRAAAGERTGDGRPGADACAAARHRELVGRPLADLDTAALPGPLRVYRAGRRVTADHRPERMNIVVGGDGRVAAVRCG